MIPLSVPVIKGNEKKYADEAISSGWVSASGSYVTRFENEMADYLKVEKTAAVQSGTAALHLSLLLSGVKQGQEVIVPALTFIAAVNPVKYLGAEPVFMDCDDSLNIDCRKLEDFLKKECTKSTLGLRNNKSKRIIRAIIAVHIFGNMADMETLVRLANEYGLKLIEDATEAYNYRMTNVQAALGVGQLECLEDYIRIKIQNYNYYKEGLKTIQDAALMPFNEKARNNHWFYSLLLRSKTGKRDSLIRQLKEAGIETRPIWKLNHTQTMYQNCQTYFIEKAPFYQSSIINLPCSVNLSEADIDFVIEALKKS